MTPNRSRNTSRSTPDDVPRPTPDRGDRVSRPRRPDSLTDARLRRRRAPTPAASPMVWLENEPSTAAKDCRGGGGGAASPLLHHRTRSRTQGAPLSIISLSPPPRSQPRSGWDSKNGSKTPHRLCSTDVLSAWRSPSTEALRTEHRVDTVDLVVVVELLRSSTQRFPRSNHRRFT